MIKYLGSKRTLLPILVNAVRADARARSVLDLFSGTARVGHALKLAGYRVVSNDHNAYAHTLARCYVESDYDEVARDAEVLIGECNSLAGRPGYFTETFCERSRFFHPKNGARVDAIRERLASLALPPELEAVMLVSLMEAADRVDSTTGVQMAYLKQWAPRAHNDLELRLPAVLPRARAGKGRALALDALDAARGVETDVAYLDPPYNQHSYLGNYHIWESLVRWDKPACYGVACKREDVRERTSRFNSKRLAEEALSAVIGAVRARTLVVSFSDEGFVTREWLEARLAERGAVATIERPYKRYVGAQIGIYSPRGERVGEVSHVRNREYIFVCGSEATVARVTKSIRIAS
ncbi:MAG: DNA adenine methylase [Gemmatimonadetes bacterium]|nr:DNA adenine methylase [Gemmatimonadota bacterium]